MKGYRTDQLIRRLAASGAPVRRLPSLWLRALIWSSVALLYVAVLALVWPAHGASIPTDGHFVVEQAAALLTGLTAAIAAFATVVPGSRKAMLLGPILPLTIWVGVVADNCVHEWSATSHVPTILAHCGCLPATLIAAVPPAAVLIVMLRRGAPIAPHVTTALAALAAAGFGNFGIRFVHTSDAGVVVLVWHLLALFLLSLGMAAIGDRFVSWRHTFAASDVPSAEC